MKYICMTSMDQRYYDHIGKHLIESWIKYWPQDGELYIYAENLDYSPTDSRIKLINWNETCEESWKVFSTKTSDSREQKFAKKGFATLHGWRNLKADRIIWLDADLLFCNSVNINDIEKSIEGSLIGLFNHAYHQQADDGWSAESGYVIVDPNHENFNDFVNRYEEIYTMPRKPEDIHGWWDNQILMFAASIFMESVKDLSQFRYKNKTQTPLNHCWLNQYMSHFKGKTKKHRTQDEFENFAGTKQ